MKFRLFLVTVCFLFFAMAIQAAPGRVAIIYKTELSRHQLIRLLEPRLSAAWELVEREEINKVLDEKKLNALLDAGSLHERQSLGQLLHANLLILISVSPENDLRIVFSETRNGFKLGQLGWPSSEVNESQLGLIEMELKQAAQKTVGPIASIVAIPPFVSRDLTGGKDVYQKALARVIETMLLNLPGVMVVDLEDAREISLEKEIAGDVINRPVPFYILGEYRYDQNNAAVPPLVKISLTQRDKIIQTKVAERISVEATVAFLRKAVSEMIPQMVKNPPDSPDPAAEIKWLNERADQLYEIGQYREAVELFESSLLLDDHQTAIHHLAMIAYGRCSRNELTSSKNYQYDREHILRALDYSNRAMEHMEAFLRKAEIGKHYAHIFNGISETFDELINVHTKDSEIRRMLYEHHLRLRSAFLQILREKQREGQLTELLMNMIWDRSLNMGHEFYNETLAANLQQRLDYVALIQDPALREGHHYAENLVHNGLSDKMRNTPQYVGFLDLIENKGDIFRQAAEKERRKLGTIIPYNNDPKELPKTDVAGVDYGRKEPQRIPDHTFKSEWLYVGLAQQPPPDWLTPRFFTPLQFYGDSKQTSSRDYMISDVLNCADKCDVVFGINKSAEYSDNRQIYIMRQKGVLKKIFSLDSDHDFGEATFDGKLAWIPITGIHSRILAIDPETERIIEFSEADGLPTPLTQAVTAQADSQSVFLSASLSRWRAFLAILRIDDNGSKTIRIIHEAARQLRTDSPVGEEYQRPDLAYFPKFMISKPGTTPESWEVAIGRSLPGGQGLDPVLLVKTEGQQTIVTKSSVESHISDSRVWFQGRNAYWIARGSIRCLSLDNLLIEAAGKLRFAPEAGPAPEQDGNVFYAKGRWHVIGRSLWATDKELAGPWRKLGDSVPGSAAYQQLFQSAFYGILLRANGALFQIDVPE